MGFSHTHLSGTGAADLGQVLIMPFTGGLDEGAGYKPLARNDSSHRFRTTTRRPNRAITGFADEL